MSAQRVAVDTHRYRGTVVSGAAGTTNIVWGTPNTSINQIGYYDSSASTTTAYGASTGAYAATAYNFNDSEVNKRSTTAFCISVRYTGNLLNAQGTFLIGTAQCGAVDNTTFAVSTFDSLRLVPTVRTVTCTQVAQDGNWCVAARPNIMGAFDFNTVGTFSVDWELPFFAFTGLPVGINVEFEITRANECVSNLGGASASVIANTIAPPVGEAAMARINKAVAIVGEAVSTAAPQSAVTGMNSLIEMLTSDTGKYNAKTGQDFRSRALTSIL
jgi:hypothetical protein